MGFVSLNRWAYNDLVKVISPSQVAVAGRSVGDGDLGLPPLPEVYDILDIYSPDFKFTKKSASEFHQELSEHFDDQMVDKFMELSSN